jgi:hypothetical protein
MLRMLGVGAGRRCCPRDRVKAAKVRLGPYRITHVHEGGEAYDFVAANVGPEASPEMVRASTFKKVSH